jgi:hypothetical protein
MDQQTWPKFLESHKLQICNLYFTELSYVGKGEVDINKYNNNDQHSRCKVFEKKYGQEYLHLRQIMKHEDGENYGIWEFQ